MLKQIFLISAFCFAFTAAGSAEPSAPLTLKQCYELALKQSETIRFNEEVIKEAEARFTQALSGILPRVSYQYDLQWRDNDGETHESKFTFSQPLFSGFKEFAAMKAGRAETRQAEYDLAHAKLTLFTDVYEAFYLLLIYERDLHALKDIQSVLQTRKTELQKRADLGRSRESEVLSSDVRIHRLDAEIELISGQRNIARELLEFLTGRTIDGIMDDSAGISEPASIEQWVVKAAQRPDVQAASEAVTAARESARAAKGELWPNISLDGNYYMTRPGGSANSERDWDVTLAVDVPLFEGRENWGLYKEAQSLALQSEWTFKETRRKAERDIRQAHVNLTSSRKRLTSLQAAEEAAEKNYAVYQDEFNRSLVSNLDVLDVLEELRDTRRDVISAEARAKTSYWNLRTSTGDISDASF